jgi:hypothetical protein
MTTRGLITFLPSSARVTSGNSGNGVFIGENSEAVIYLDVTAASGTTPTLAVIVEDTIDGTNWDTIASFTQATGITREVKRISNLSRYIRIKYTIGGTTPSFTFCVRGYIK